MTIATSSVRAVLVNSAEARTERVFPIQVVLPDEPMGQGFVSAPDSAEMGKSVTLQLDVQNASSCSVTLGSPGGLQHGASVNIAAQATGCPNAVVIMMGNVPAAGYIQEAYLTAPGLHPENKVLIDTIRIRQIMPEQVVDSPQVIEVVSGISSAVILKSKDCRFIKRNPGVHLGTEVSDFPDFSDPLPIPSFLSPCEIGYQWGSGRVDPGEWVQYFAVRRADGAYTKPYGVRFVIRSQ
jgi:hypothetical protein